MPKFEIRNTSHIGSEQFKKILKRTVLSRQTVGVKMGKAAEKRTRKGFLESRTRIEVQQDIDEERFTDWVVEGLYRWYQGPNNLVLHIKQIDDSEPLDIPELEDSEPFDIYGLGIIE